ncbi:MAG: response regulator transcription factor [Betaproteobacteria bacterium]
MRVLLAGRQALVREGLKRVALEIDDTCEFVEAADSVSASAALLRISPFDAVWFDEGFFPIDELAALRQAQPRLPLLALVGKTDEGARAALLSAGANALVPRSAPIGVLSAALRLVLAGDVCVRSNDLAHAEAVHAQWRIPGARHGTGPLNLTSRQYDVLALIAQGCANKAIAGELGIGLRTVKGHVSVILRALHVDNRADAGRAARRWLGRAAPPQRANPTA